MSEKFFPFQGKLNSNTLLISANLRIIIGVGNSSYKNKQQVAQTTGAHGCYKRKGESTGSDNVPCNEKINLNKIYYGKYHNRKKEI